jgi:regulator of replication initiation timing
LAKNGVLDALAKVLVKMQNEMPENAMGFLQSCLAPSLDLQHQLQTALEENQRLQNEVTDLKQQLQRKK